MNAYQIHFASGARKVRNFPPIHTKKKRPACDSSPIDFMNSEGLERKRENSIDCFVDRCFIISSIYSELSSAGKVFQSRTRIVTVNERNSKDKSLKEKVGKRAKYQRLSDHQNGSNGRNGAEECCPFSATQGHLEKGHPP
jgi:hypothetical protein